MSVAESPQRRLEPIPLEVGDESELPVLEFAADLSQDLQFGERRVEVTNRHVRVLTGANETDKNSWKEFDARSANLSVTYDRAPYQPTGLTTSPATACAGDPPSTVGDADVTLYAPAADPDRDNLTVIFELWRAATSPTGTLVDRTVLTDYPLDCRRSWRTTDRP